MKLQVLVATMHQNDHSLLDKMNIQSDAVVINQCNYESCDEFNDENNKTIWVNTKERGLSKSRNMALKKATADICILADDDLVYIDNYKNIILEQFLLYSHADIITFQVEGIEKKFKNYHSKSRKLNYLTSMKASSVEIAFRPKSIKDKGIKFNELFGAGAKYFAGEENIFLFDCLKKGLKIQYVPIKIANLHIGDSTWFKGFDNEYFITKGAIFTAMSRTFSLVFILQFAIRKYNLYKDEITIFCAIKYMLAGRKKYSKEKAQQG